ncbi:MAG TPA: pitrilysin family protein [Bryobacteraceae bacterium]|nr:pitrilysin family protein [Bryobacteraceae bacterium]
MRALCSLLLPAILCSQTLEVRTHTLTNGLKLIIHEDHDIPNVAMYLFYRVGSRNEQLGVTGISHFFEHMMFNGAKKYGPHQFDVEMEKNGGRNNAYTSRDVTVYTDWFPAPILPLMMDMEADRMRSLGFDPKMVESERGVVYSEREQSVDNSNFGLLYEQLNAAAFTAHPYGWPVVGWASDIKAWTIDDLKKHFAMGYAPNNCLMVVAGDVKATAVIDLAKKEFEGIGRQDPPPAVRTVEPKQQGERRVTIVKTAQLPIQMFSYHVPKAAHDDSQVLQVLGSVLSQGQSSRLYRRMVDGEQVALSQSFSLDPTLDPGQLIFTIQPRGGVDPALSEKIFLEELETVRKREIPAGELRKAKNQLLTGLYRDMKTISGKANLLGNYEIFLGDYRKLFFAQQDLEAVTSAQVLRAAREYLGPLNRTAATLTPEPQPEKAEQTR